MKAYQKLALITGLLSAPLCADTIVLKTGVKYQGKVISEDATSYLVEINVTKSIKDERTILKDNVKEIIKESSEKVDFEKVGPLVPTPDQLSTEKYQERIQKAESFIKAHPTSTHTEKLKEALTILKKELTAITAGGTKLGGKIVTADELKTDTYDIHAQLLYQDFKKLSSQKRYQPALKKWEILKNEYKYSSAYVSSLPHAERVLKSYESQLTRDLASLDSRMMDRKTSLSRLDINERKRVEQSINKKEMQQKAVMEKEKAERNTRWLTTGTFDATAMKANQRSAKAELLRLERLDTSKIELVGPIFRSAWEALDNDKLSEATKTLHTLQRFRLDEKYTEPLHALLKKKQLMKEAEKASPTKEEPKATESMSEKKEGMTDKEQK